MRFNNWNLEMDTFPVRQYDNLTRRLEVSGDIPDGWSWAALLSIGDKLNIISLQYGEPGLYVDLTADMIPYAGKYNLQLRATQGDKVRHTNIVQMQVNDSMSGDAVWPELPSEFSQAEQRIAEYNDHPPKPGDNGFWLLWNVETDQYEESDIPLPSGGGSGSDGGYYTPEVTQPSADTMQVSFEASEDNMPPVEPVSVTLPAGPAGKDGEDGAPGLPGQDGYSPMVQTAAIDGGTRVTITDATGPKTFEVLNGTNGKDGQPGQDGAPGQDGFSPTASVTQTADGAKITITDKSGTTNATITNGKDGTNGTDGQTPNITPGNIETLPAGSNVTASITGQTPNLVLNLGIPQGPAGAGVPPTDTAQAGDVPTWNGEDVVWAAQSGGGGAKPIRFLNRIETVEAVKSIEISEDVSGNTFESLNLTEVYLEFKTAEEVDTSYDYGVVRVNGKGIAKGQNFSLTTNFKFFALEFLLCENGNALVIFQDGSSSVTGASGVAFGIAIELSQTDNMAASNFGGNIHEISVGHANSAAEAVLKAGTIILVYGR